ncbi:MAG: hypothetical protein ACLR4W_02515 [Oscillospiraceae bacterium]
MSATPMEAKPSRNTAALARKKQTIVCQTAAEEGAPSMRRAR